MHHKIYKEEETHDKVPRTTHSELSITSCVNNTCLLWVEVLLIDKTANKTEST